MESGLNLPPLPEGFELQNEGPSIPPLPPGFELEKKQTPSQKFLKEAGRHTARSSSRVVESIIGLPGDVLRSGQSAASFISKGPEKIREKIGLKPLNKDIAKPSIPGSQELKEISTKLFGDIVVPQSETESFIDDVVSDASVLAIPVKGKIPFMRAIGSAIAGNIAGKGAEKLGAGETGQTSAKLGAFFLSGLAGRGNVKKFWNQQYSLAEKAIPDGAKLQAFKLDRQLDNLSHELTKGGIETPSQRFVQKPLKELQKIIHDGELRVEDAVAAKIKINELRSGLFEEVKGKGGQKYARTKINEIANFLDESLEKYGRENPNFYKHYKAANEAYGGYHQSRRVSEWINKTIPFGRLGKAGGLILEAIFKPATLKATIPALGAVKGGEVITRMLKNPTLRRFYGNLIKDAVNENKAGVLRNIKSLEKEIQEKDPDLFSSLE